jgi:epoxyqueuosine reductase
MNGEATINGSQENAPTLEVATLQAWAQALGFSQIAVSDVDLSHAEPGLLAWLQAGFHGGMDYMARHGLKRARPAELVPGTVRVLSARMDYLPRHHLGAESEGPEPDWRTREWQRLSEPSAAVVSAYARGRDYHKVLRQRLQKLADRMTQALAQLHGPDDSSFSARVFTDSAPVLEVELATRSGLGWRGKHTLALSRSGGSMFFIGEIFVNAPLPLTPPTDQHCGACTRCLDICPTQAIVAPYRLDARRCISYLTIEHDGPIPEALRSALGNRIYGCDDCQLVCPWNKFARRSALADFDVRGPLDQPTLLALWAWSEADFLRHTEGSPIRRIGFERWQRNLAVALGNAVQSNATPQALRQAMIQALQQRKAQASELVREHIDWALIGA